MKIIAVAMACLAMTACRPETAPVRAARTYAAAVRKNDCALMWSLLAAGARANIESRHTWHPAFESERAAYCGQFRVPFDPGSVKLRWIQDDHALVSVMERVPAGFLVPGFWPTRFEARPWDFPLVREQGAWKIDFDHLRRPARP